MTSFFWKSFNIAFQGLKSMNGYLVFNHFWWCLRDTFIAKPLEALCFTMSSKISDFWPKVTVSVGTYIEFARYLQHQQHDWSVGQYPQVERGAGNPEWFIGWFHGRMVEFASISGTWRFCFFCTLYHSTSPWTHYFVSFCCSLAKQSTVCMI